MTDGLQEIVGELEQLLGPIFEMMEWAEDEIAAAQKRQRSKVKKDLVWSTFKLLRPTDDLMRTEFVYRSHCREIIERVLKGEDTRLGTAAEACAVCCNSSLLAPLTTTGAGLYFRMWSMAFPDHEFPAQSENREHYESLKGRQIDEAESEVRKKTTQDWRKL